MLSPVVRSTVATAAAMGSLAGPVSVSLSTMGLAERCLISLDAETDQPLTFPRSAIPMLSIGLPTTASPRLPYYRGAAVASLIVHLVALIVGAVIAAGLRLSGWDRERKWYIDLLVRAPVGCFMILDGLLLDGGVSGGATVMSAEGPHGVGYLLCGLFGPVATILLTVVLSFRRSMAYYPNWLLEHDAEKRDRLVKHHKEAVGIMHRVIVGMGAWHAAAAAPSTATTLPAGGASSPSAAAPPPPVSLLPLSAYGRYRGPSTDFGSWLDRVCPYYFSFSTTIYVIMSAARALATKNSCLISCVLVAILCSVLFVVLLVLRPMTSIGKNVVAIVMSLYAALNAWLLFFGAYHHMDSLIAVAMSLATWGAILSVVHIILVCASSLLTIWANRRAPEGSSTFTRDAQGKLLLGLDGEDGTDKDLLAALWEDLRHQEHPNKGQHRRAGGELLLEEEDGEELQLVPSSAGSVVSHTSEVHSPPRTGTSKPKKQETLDDLLADVLLEATHDAPKDVQQQPSSPGRGGGMIELLDDSPVAAAPKCAEPEVTAVAKPRRPAQPLSQLRDVRYAIDL